MATDQPSIHWISAVQDVPASRFDTVSRFWSGITGYPLSVARGAAGELATLVPPAEAAGDAYLGVQRLGAGQSRLHLHLHVAGTTATAVAAKLAVAAGATELGRPDGFDGHVVLRSPGGLVFCVVDHPGSAVPAPSAWPGVSRSRVYQVCLDIPTAAYEVETAFWAVVTGRSLEVLGRRPEFAWLRSTRPPIALDLLVQRLIEPEGAVRAHLDVGTTDRDAEVRRHLGMGARVLGEEEFWTVLADPAGSAYCVTDRDPGTGRLA